MHHTLFALPAIADIIVAGVKKMIKPALILQDRTGAECRIRVGHHPVIECHAQIIIADQIVSTVSIDGVITLAVMVSVVKIIEFEPAVLCHKRHCVTDVGTFRRRKQLAGNLRVRFIRQTA